ncbi:unnamed protein product [Symbiodinium natans]|uniref:Uncharacterized protein n=1 Tax=Symbiodinium natans TaxID=878477 RepID=A0A812PLR1_9DINO|nr:unnamed protein product [Symbiodinium natans]
MAKTLSAAIILAALVYSEAGDVEICKYMQVSYTGKHQYMNHVQCTQVLHGSAVTSGESSDPISFVLTVTCASDSCTECDHDPVKFYGQCSHGALTGKMFHYAAFNMTGIVAGPLANLSLLIDVGSGSDGHYEFNEAGHASLDPLHV